MNNELKLRIKKLYNDQTNEQIKRYEVLINQFRKKFNKKETEFFSSPGRTELSGNHTDHNHGKVIAASINLDSIAAAAPNNLDEVLIYSEGFKNPFKVNLKNLKPVPEEKGTTSALIRGIAAGLKKNGYKTGGFNAVFSSDVLIGSGLSSSASIEVLIGKIFSWFFNDDKIHFSELAKIGQYSENNFFGKPCGLMDQMACASGGIISINFNDPKNPVIEKVNYNFTKNSYSLIVVDTGGNHADLTDDYASIPKEMKKIAKYFNKNFCSEIDPDEFVKNIKILRKKVNDRAILRTFHFIEENKRVDKQINTLRKKDFDAFLKLVNDSGNSSFKYLQNIYSNKNVLEQGVSLALAMSDIFIKSKGEGACRVHGGGFAGTIQVFLPKNLIKEYKNFMSNAFDEKAVKVLSIRDKGVICLKELKQ